MNRAQSSRVNGANGGKPPQYPPCAARKDNAVVRHRFVKGVCKCGVVAAPGLYKFEEHDGITTWYVKSGKDWKPAS